MAGEVRVRGLSELNRALSKADKDVRLGIKGELRQAAEPVRADAERLVQSGITHMTHDWAQMRVGLLRDSVYVAPRKRGARRGPRRRPNLFDLMLPKMDEALEQNRDEVEERLDDLLGRVAGDFNR